MQLSVIAKTGSLVATCAHEQNLCVSWYAKVVHLFVSNKEVDPIVHLFVSNKEVDPKPVGVQMLNRCMSHRNAISHCTTSLP